MSSADPPAGASRHTNDTNSVNGSDAGISGAGGSREIPTPVEKLSEFSDKYPDLAALPIADRDGARVRKRYAHEEEERWVSEDGEAAGVDRTYEPVTWGEAVKRLLEKHEDTRHTTVNLEKGYAWDDDFAEHHVAAENRFMESYQRRYFAQLKAWLRELTGGERPSGGEAKPTFDDPYLVLLTRSASASPDGDRLAPVDHTSQLQESWEPVYHKLRNDMRALGFTLGEDYQYCRIMEPHTGKRAGDGGGGNSCYPHEHIVIAVDGEVNQEMFSGVVEKHVDETPAAGEEAHDLEGTVEVKPAGEVDNLAAYVASYAGVQPEDLLERSPEYIGFAAAVTAGNVRTFTRSDAANNAASADRCKQQYESERSDQVLAHGERVVPSDRRGVSYECAACGSPWGIDQDQTLTAHRLNEESEVVADGGHDREEELKERWGPAEVEYPDGTVKETSGAIEAAAVGEGPKRKKWRGRIENWLENNPDKPATPELVLLETGIPQTSMSRRLVNEVLMGEEWEEAVGFNYGDEWRLVSVSVYNDEHPATNGRGVEMVTIERERRRVREAMNVEPGLYTCECGATFGHTDMESHLMMHGFDEMPAEIPDKISPADT